MMESTKHKGPNKPKEGTGGGTLTVYDVAVCGAGISGVAAAKNCLEEGLATIVFEREDHVAGLWQFKEHGYGVMKFTHINVSKQNYCFSDFPFPEDTPDYPSWQQMAAYVNNYVDHFDVRRHIRFQTEIQTISRSARHPELWEIIVQHHGGAKAVYYARNVAIATGHHAIPTFPSFKGEKSFPGRIIHSVDFKDALTNDLAGKRVLIVGIGNSAIDAATNVCTVAKKVVLSTRSGAWVIPNYIFGVPTDQYANRFLFSLPWRWASSILELIVSTVHGSPFKWGLRPKMRALQSQPTVSATLIHHIQRQDISIALNVDSIDGSRVTFSDGSSAEFDDIVYCTGYKISVPYLEPAVQDLVIEKSSNRIRLYKNVFSPELGPSISFIGFVQPASGGVLTMAETQARWFIGIIKGRAVLPTKEEMLRSMEKDQAKTDERYFGSRRHTIQRDPLVYCDEIAGFFGAKPSIWRHPSLFLHLLFGTGCAAQWRLQGPGKWDKAAAVVRSSPIAPMWRLVAYLLFTPLAITLVRIVLTIIARRRLASRLTKKLTV